MVFIILRGKSKPDCGVLKSGGRGSLVLGGVGAVSSGDRPVTGRRTVTRNTVGPLGGGVSHDPCMCSLSLLVIQGLETKYMEILRFQASEEESWAAPPPVSQPPPCNR